MLCEATGKAYDAIVCAFCLVWVHESLSSNVPTCHRRHQTCIFHHWRYLKCRSGNKLHQKNRLHFPIHVSFHHHNQNFIKPQKWLPRVSCVLEVLNAQGVEPMFIAGCFWPAYPFQRRKNHLLFFSAPHCQRFAQMPLHNTDRTMSSITLITPHVQPKILPHWTRWHWFKNFKLCFTWTSDPQNIKGTLTCLSASHYRASGRKAYEPASQNICFSDHMSLIDISCTPNPSPSIDPKFFLKTLTPHPNSSKTGHVNLDEREDRRKLRIT